MNTIGDAARVVARLVACVMAYHARSPVSRDTALHKQRDVLQPSGLTQYSSILYVSPILQCVGPCNLFVSGQCSHTIWLIKTVK